MRYRPMFNSRMREALWLREKNKAYLAGRGKLPICNICDLPVCEQDAWDESHNPAKAKAFGGKATGIAHRLCNRQHGAAVVTPAVAKSNRVRRFHIGASGPGLGRYTMSGGRWSPLTKTFRHGVQLRLTGAERHALTMAKRAIVPDTAAP